jgi:hypothetical protein
MEGSLFPLPLGPSAPWPLSAFLRGDDVYAGELLFEFLASTVRTFVLPFLKVTDGEREDKDLITTQALEFVGWHVASK